MKKYLLTAIVSVLSICTHAQSIDREGNDSKRIWTTEFNSVDINAPIKVIFKRVAADIAPYVIYTANDSTSSVFTAEVDKRGVLKIREKNSGKRASITEVEVYYHDLEDIRISRADVLFSDTLDHPIADIEITDGAHVRAAIDMTDIKLAISNKCAVELSGYARYIAAEVSSSVLNAPALNCMSCRIEASHSSDIDISVDERLEAEVSYGAKIRYSGAPAIVRRNVSIFSGEIIGEDVNTDNISSDAAHE
ncbi:MAG: DUF2807 domain-containing protein [Alistipes sp.]|nr:DUF2807 domain-containing protein [Alistipes sp.]